MDFNDKIRCFFSLIDDFDVDYFLYNDICNVFADNIHLATVFTYFDRAELIAEDYHSYMFFLALYIVHDVQDEVNAFKREVMGHALGYDAIDEIYFVHRFITDKFTLLKRLNFNTSVDHADCLQLFQRAPHKIWDRIRRSNHVGVCTNLELACDTCGYPSVTK